jgi:hypothetical protein
MFPDVTDLTPEERHTAHDLELFADNSGNLYNLKQLSFQELNKRRKNGTYDKFEAGDVLHTFIEAAARQYMREVHTEPKQPWYVKFTLKIRMAVANEYVKEYEASLLDKSSKLH